MEDKIITFSANEQGLQKTGGISHYASDTVSYVKATFDLGTNWQGFDEVRAVFKTPFDTRSAVLNSLGECEVPFEILMHKAVVRVNLVGSIVTEEEVTDRLTTYSVEALTIDEDVPISGDSSVPITPSEYEQFVAKVKEDANRAEAEAEQATLSAQASEASAIRASGHALDAESSATSARAYAQNAQNSATNAENAKDDAIDARDEIRSMRANAETLEPNQSATASYSNGVLTLGIPKGQKGDKGDKGDTPNISIGNVETLEPSEDAYVTRRGTDANPIFDFGIPKGDKGDTGTVPDLDLILPTDTASGDIASITDGQSVVPVKSLKVTLEPIQSGSGTPSPDNVRPISGHTECVTEVCGKNLLDESLIELGSFGSNGAKIADDDARYRRFEIVLSAGTYTFVSTLTNCHVIRILANNVEQTYSGSQPLTFTLSEDATVKLAFRNTGTTAITEEFKTMVQFGSTASAYEPYIAPTTYTTTLGQTVYGGTLEQVGGTLDDSYGYADLGDWNWGYNASGSTVSPYFYANVRSLGLKRLGPFGTTVHHIVCSNYATVARNTTAFVNGTICADGDANEVQQIQIKDDRFTDATSFKQAMSGVQLCYELATPQTYQLDPQTISLLHGNNNVWSDGEVELTYNADVQLWVLKQLGTSGTRTLSMTRTLDTKSEETKTDDTKSDNIQLAED